MLDNNKRFAKSWRVDNEHDFFPGGPLNYTAVHTRDHRFFEPTLSKFYPLVKFIPYSSIFACFFDNFAP